MNKLEQQKKVVFFAQYYGQELITHQNYEDKNWPLSKCYPELGKGNFVLLLTPLSMITDEQALSIAQKALFHTSIEDWNNQDVYIGEGDSDNVGNHSLEVGMRCWKGLLTINSETGFISLEDEEGESAQIYSHSIIVDHLRKIGVAFNFDGISVEEQISRGWIKLRNNE